MELSKEELKETAEFFESKVFEAFSGAELNAITFQVIAGRLHVFYPFLLGEVEVVRIVDYCREKKLHFWFQGHLAASNKSGVAMVEIPVWKKEPTVEERGFNPLETLRKLEAK